MIVKKNVCFDANYFEISNKFGLILELKCFKKFEFATSEKHLLEIKDEYVS